MCVLQIYPPTCSRRQATSFMLIGMLYSDDAIAMYQKVGLTPQAVAGDVKAKYKLASCYHWGFGCEPTSALSKQYADGCVQDLLSLASAGDTEVSQS